MECDDGSGGGGLTQRDVGDGSAAAEDADPTLALAGVGGDRVKDVAAAADLQDVGPESVGALAGDDHGGLGLVLGARGSASRATGHDIARALVLTADEVKAPAARVASGVVVFVLIGGGEVAVAVDVMVVIVGVRGNLEVKVRALKLLNKARC